MRHVYSVAKSQLLNGAFLSHPLYMSHQCVTGLAHGDWVLLSAPSYLFHRLLN
jgi:hypothetical protein